jgi:hypothetical protein
MPPFGDAVSPSGGLGAPLITFPEFALASQPGSGRIRCARSLRTRMGRTARGCSFGGPAASRFCVRSPIRGPASGSVSIPGSCGAPRPASERVRSRRRDRWSPDGRHDDASSSVSYRSVSSPPRSTTIGTRSSDWRS